MEDWNPDQYLKFKDERTQPSIDLISRIKCDHMRTILDIGCGPGNSTQVLYGRWPDADVVGLDSSEQMIRKAQQDFPKQKWILADIAAFESETTYDLVFSNATLQWIHQHDQLIPRLFNLSNENGILAVQVPANHESPLHQSLLAISSKQKWHRFTKGCENLLNYRKADYYDDLLVPLVSRMELWQTEYYHVLNSHTGLIEWYKSTGMRPFLDKLPDEVSRNDFQNEVLEDCKKSYPARRDGKIVYPFKRLFFIAYKK